MTWDKKRTLGRSGITVSAMGIGLWAIGGPWEYMGNPAGWGKVDDAESIRAVEAAVDMGVTFLDTAANYGAGHSEEILARALKGRRHEVLIASKFGNRIDPTRKAVSEYDDPASHVREDCEASLRRLRTDVIDLYQFHVNDYDPEKALAVREELENLVEAGKIRAYGWSTDFPERAAVFAHGEHCAAVQAPMNVVNDNPDMITLSDRFDLAFICRGPLGMGFLTGKYDHTSTWPENDVRNTAWVREGFLIPILTHLPIIREILTADGRSPAQGALAWLWARSPRTIPIPGVRTVAQVRENVRALEKGPLDRSRMREIERLLGRDTSA
ncbi:MAG TPA: aldo/keto reductase [Spirochaetia bacterium]|nr:aldo/keto reductase [Spirochaetia bacterium]